MNLKRDRRSADDLFDHIADSIEAGCFAFLRKTAFDSKASALRADHYYLVSHLNHLERRIVLCNGYHEADTRALSALPREELKHGLSELLLVRSPAQWKQTGIVTNADLSAAVTSERKFYELRVLSATEALISVV